MSTPGQTPSPPQVQSLYCPNCGAPLAIRGMGKTVSVVCEHCLTVLDARDSRLQILQQFQARERIMPLIPLGTRGKWRGDPWEAIGFQVRTIVVDGVAYSWAEYVLFNPYKGFRYLTEYQGHWNDVTTLRTLPEVSTKTARPVARVLGKAYAHFQSAEAETTYVVGEFPWQVRVGERAQVMDFVAPPQMLSREKIGEEIVWSLGEYVTGATIWQAFQLPGQPPAAQGTYANQPSPHKGGVKEMWVVCGLLLLALLMLSQAVLLLARNEEVLRNAYSFSPGTGQEASFVTGVFELKGRTSDVEVEIHTDLSNNWAYLNFALINSDTGQAFDFGREVSYYSGRDSDGDWSEGHRDDSVLIPSVPAGRYYLRVEPEMDANALGMRYEITLRRDVPVMSYFWIAGVLLLVPAFVYWFRSRKFEMARWSESDYAGTSSSGDDD